MVFLSPIPTSEELQTIYQADYYDSWGLAADEGESTRAMKHATFSNRIKKISARLRPHNVLDVGCATGFFLEAATQEGWTVFGVELSKYAAATAKKKFGERIFNGTLEDAHYADNAFDLVTLSDLLEHIPCPQDFLGEVRRILTQDGLLMIVTPDVSSLTARLMGSRWSHYKAEHLHYFSPRTITRLLAENGFTVECLEPASKCLNLSYIVNQFKVYPHPLITPLCRAVETLLPASLLKKNMQFRCGEMLVLAKKLR